MGIEVSSDFRHVLMAKSTEPIDGLVMEHKKVVKNVSKTVVLTPGGLEFLLIDREKVIGAELGWRI